MNEIMVSVIIITYNQEQYIRQCLDSVFAQKTNFKFEVIVAEDASPDNTRAILLEYKEKYGDQLVLVLHDENVGPSKNSRSAREVVQGKYVTGLEGDDYWTDEYKLQKQFDILENHPQYSAVCCDYAIVSAEGKMIAPKNLDYKKDRVKTMKDWLREGYTLHTCTIFRRPFDENDERYKKLRSVATTMGDTITFTLLYASGDIYVLKDSMSAHRMAGKRDTTSFSFTQKAQAIKYSYMYYDIVKALEEYLDRKYDVMQLFINRLSKITVDKLAGNLLFSFKEMKPLFERLNGKQKWVYVGRVIKIFYKRTIRKVKKMLKAGK